MNKKYYLFLGILIFLVIILNVFNQRTAGFNNEIEMPEYIETDIYYQEINFTDFEELTNKKEVSIVAIDDNTSYTYEDFKEQINLISYKENIAINYLNTSKLNNEDEVLFYENYEILKEYTKPFIVIYKNNKLIKTIENKYEEQITEYIK